MTKTEMRAKELLHVLNAGACTANDICDEMGWTRLVFDDAVRALRDYLALSGQPITVVAESPGAGQPALYGLLAGRNLRSSNWYRDQLRSNTRHLKTFSHVTMAGVVDTDGRTIEGRAARQAALTAARLVEDIEFLEAGV